ncbi:MAG: G8 domain-containing protein [Pseudomonadota bacterium]
MIITLEGASVLTYSQLVSMNGGSIGSDDIVVVPPGAELIMDTDAELGGLVVQGLLTVEDGRDIELSSDWVAVIDGGHFQVGTEDDPHVNDFTLTLTGDDPNQNVNISEILMQAGQSMMPGMDEMVLEDQDAFLMVMGEGSRLDLHGVDAAKTSWTQLDGTAEAGATSITLVEAFGWEVGDRIAIASTDFDPDQAEELTITGVSDDGLTITFEPPLDYMHYGEVDRYDDPDGDVHQLDMRAEVALLSRNVKIQGDVDYDPDVPLSEQDDQFGGHTMVMNDAEMYVSGTEFAYMGQAGTLGRYPVHWHEMDDVSGQYITDSSVHHSFNKGITIHGSDNAEVSDNVVFETISHNYYFEDGSETGNVLTGNLGMGAREPGRFGEIRGANDGEPANFYTSNGDNVWIGNHAAGSEDKNFYFNLTRGEGRDFGTFEDNAAHSAEGRGFYLNHGGLIQDGSPSGSADQPQEVDPWEVDGLTVYKNNGVYVRGVEGTFTDSAFAEMGSNARFRLNQTIEDSLIVGRSDNIGNPQTDEEIEAGRSLPGGDGDFQGFQLYDGPGSLSNVMFDGFEEGDAAIDLSNAIHKSASFGAEGITWGDNVHESAKVSIGGGGNAIGNDAWARGIVDVDGSLTGQPGAMIYQYSSDRDGSRVFNAGEDYEVIEEWGAIVSYGTTSGTLRIDNNIANTGANRGVDKSGFTVTRSDGETASGIRHQIPVFEGYSYTIDYRDIEDQFRLYLHDMDWGDSVIFNLGPTPTGSSFTVDDPNSGASRPAREVSSMAMLEASPDTAVYRDEAGEVHIKLVAEMAHGYVWPQPGVTYNDTLHSGVTVIVDTEADLDLDALIFDDPGPDDTLPPPPYAEGQGPSADEPAPQPPAEDPAPEEPPVEEPVAEVPSDDPTPEPPADEDPADAPSDEEPVAEDPPADPPAEEPVAEDPAPADPPAEDPAPVDPPVEEPPAEDPPADDPPAEDPVGEAPPADAPPAEDPPADAPPTEDPVEEEPALAVISLTLVDLESGEPGGAFDGTFDPATQTLIAETDVPVRSMGFYVDGALMQIENRVPYAIFGDRDGDYFAGDLASGDYELEVRAFSGRNGNGEVLAQTVSDLTVPEPIVEAPIPEPPVEEAPEPEILSLALVDLETGERDTDFDGAINFETHALIAESEIPISSIGFYIGGELIQMENKAPYAMFGNRGEDFFTSELDAGAHDLEVRAFSDERGQGELVASMTAELSVVDPEEEAIAMEVLAASSEAEQATDITLTLVDVESGQESFVFDPAHDTIIAETDLEVGSMGFFIDGELFQIENKAPYALFGNRGDTYWSRDLPSDSSELEVRAFADRDAEGEVLASVSLDLA